jgi:hypothetical protein
MTTPDDWQLKAEIDEIGARIDKIVKKVRQYYPEPDETNNSNPDPDEGETNQQSSSSSDLEA